MYPAVASTVRGQVDPGAGRGGAAGSSWALSAAKGSHLKRLSVEAGEGAAGRGAPLRSGGGSGAAAAPARVSWARPWVDRSLPAALSSVPGG